MTKKRVLTIAVCVLLVLSTLLFAACTGNAATHFEDLEKEADAVAASFQKTAEAFEKEDTYTYTYSVETEELSNFVYDSKEMPTDKVWYKPTIDITFTRVKDAWYQKIEITDIQRNEDGSLKLKDGNRNKPVYADKVTMELWQEASGRFQVRINGTDVFVYEAYEAEAALRVYSYLPNLYFPVIPIGDVARNSAAQVGEADYIEKDAIFAADTRSWFGEKLARVQSYYVVPSGGADLLPYRTAEESYAAGFGEDLTFKWENLDGAVLTNVGWTRKKERPVCLEIHQEVFFAYQKKAVQIWNNDAEAINWHGDRGFAAKMIVEIQYPAKKVTVEIPAAPTTPVV